MTFTIIVVDFSFSEDPPRIPWPNFQSTSAQQQRAQGKAAHNQGWYRITTRVGWIGRRCSPDFSSAPERGSIIPVFLYFQQNELYLMASLAGTDGGICGVDPRHLLFRSSSSWSWGVSPSRSADQGRGWKNDSYLLSSPICLMVYHLVRTNCRIFGANPRRLCLRIAGNRNWNPRIWPESSSPR